MIDLDNYRVVGIICLDLEIEKCLANHSANHMSPLGWLDDCPLDIEMWM